MNLIDRAKAIKEGAGIIHDWLGAGAITVQPDHAQRRANICIACPMNIKGGIVTAAVAQAVKRQVSLKNKLNLRVTGEKSLGRCSACFCESKLKIWLPLERIKPDAQDVKAFHESCWLRSESQNK